MLSATTRKEQRSMTTRVNLQRALGGSGITVPALGVGTNRWGSQRGKNNASVFQAFQSSLDNGPMFFDTAEVYSGGNSERLLGDCMRRDTRPMVIASKFAPLPTRLSPHALMDALDASLSRLGVEVIDLYYIHWPFTLLRINALMDMMALAVRIGKIRAVGVSNYNAKQMRQAAARLARYNIPLAANQVHYSLLHRQPETDGVLDACRELNVALVAYRPLESGRLLTLEERKAETTPEATPVHQEQEKASKQEQLAGLRQMLASVAQAHGKTINQVALNWLLRRDEHVIAIPGATSSEHLLDNLGALDWELSEEEFDEISKVSVPWKR